MGPTPSLLSLSCTARLPELWVYWI